MMRLPTSLTTLTAFVVLVGTAAFGQTDPTKETGLRGRIIVAPELLAATEWPVDASRAEALKTPANVRRPRGRPLLPLTEALPEIAVVIEGDDVRGEPPSPRTLVIEGMRFVPGQVLLSRPGPVAIENKQGMPLTILDTAGKALKSIAPGATEQVDLPEGLHTLTMKELPYARATVRVLPRGKVLAFDENGDIPNTPLAAGDYKLAFYLGAAELRRQDLVMPEKGLLFIDATISANTVVDVTVKDASAQIAVPVSDALPPPP